MISNPIDGKIKNVPNHQPVYRWIHLGVRYPPISGNLPVPPGFIKAVEVRPQRECLAPLAQHAARLLRCGRAEGEHGTAEVEGTQQAKALIEVPGSWWPVGAVQKESRKLLKNGDSSILTIRIGAGFLWILWFFRATSKETFTWSNEAGMNGSRTAQKNLGENLTVASDDWYLIVIRDHLCWNIFGSVNPWRKIMGNSMMYEITMKLVQNVLESRRKLWLK